MPLLRLLFAGLVALFAMVAVLFTAAVVFLTGLVAWSVQLFRPRGSRPVPGGPAVRQAGGGEVIDIEATVVPEKPATRLP